MPRKAIKKPGASFPSGLRGPIQIESLGLWPGSLTRDEIIKQLSEQGGEKLNALVKHYNIPLHSPEKWKHLSWCLAEELGLMEVMLKRPKKPHASRVWSEKEIRLVERIDKKIAERRQRGLSVSIRNIARYLIADPEFKHLTVKSVVNRYGEAKRRRAQGSLASPPARQGRNPEKISKK
jgi:hypothetical protein